VSLSNVMKGFLPERQSSYIISELNTYEAAPPQTDHLIDSPVSTYDRETAAVLKQAQEDADQILKNAYIKAKAINDEAEAESYKIYERSFKTARTEGYSAGYSLGMAKAQDACKKELKQTVCELKAVSESLERQIEDFIKGSRTAILDVASEIARKIVGDNFTLGEEVFYDMFEKVVKAIPQAERLILTVSGNDYPIIARDPEKLVKLAQGFENVEIRYDETAAPGSMLIESSLVMLDASLDRQIDLIKKELNAYSA